MTPLIHSALPTPELHVDAAGVVRSAQYDDVYFSKHGGVEETRYVFLAQNQLPQRWCEKPHFVIAETGFGTGLNFLTTWQAFADTAPKHHHLTYISVEQHPLTHQQMQAVHVPSSFTSRLLEILPPCTPGFHLLHVDSQMDLLLLYGDACEQFGNLNAHVDVWFLDGFAPAKNTTMWQPLLFQQMVRLSVPDTSFATFTCARSVRDGLQDAGFITEKVKGFGHKRQMLRGYKP